MLAPPRFSVPPTRFTVPPPASAADPVMANVPALTVVAPV